MCSSDESIKYTIQYNTILNVHQFSDHLPPSLTPSLNKYRTLSLSVLYIQRDVTSQHQLYVFFCVSKIYCVLNMSPVSPVFYAVVTVSVLNIETLIYNIRCPCWFAERLDFPLIFSPNLGKVKI